MALQRRPSGDLAAPKRPSGTRRPCGFRGPLGWRPGGARVASGAGMTRSSGARAALEQRPREAPERRPNGAIAAAQWLPGGARAASERRPSGARTASERSTACLADQADSGRPSGHFAAFRQDARASSQGRGRTRSPGAASGADPPPSHPHCRGGRSHWPTRSWRRPRCGAAALGGPGRRSATPRYSPVWAPTASLKVCAGLAGSVSKSTQGYRLNSAPGLGRSTTLHIGLYRAKLRDVRDNSDRSFPGHGRIRATGMVRLDFDRSGI